MQTKAKPTPYGKKPSMVNTDYQIHYNKDTSLTSLRGVHSHDYYEFYFFMSGRVTYHVEGQQFQLQAGDIMLIQPGQKHYAEITASMAYERYVLWLHPDYLQLASTETTNLLQPFNHINCLGCHLNLPNDMVILVNHLLDNILIQSVSNEYGSDMLARSFINELLIRIARTKMYHQSTYFSTDFNNNDLLANALNYIHQHIYESIHVQDIADATFVSKSFLSKKFTDSMKISIHKYIVRKKLYLSRQELLHGSSIDAVFEKYSFGDYSSFYRAFKKEFGMSPKEYKKFMND
ncbi:AraC family transcriptional regulator [Paenibacillus sanguinis]|uniref:AraC family transcriptional regulator n=1 Tax=Paenibacillus sanguinis TaxID=225906 RepID=UPI0003637BF8|nr:AraC family transcriptional regulator [Paenibacillus sanguinis]